jgi:hypothetical protein
VALFLRTLPAEARLSRRPGDEAEWSIQTELLAQLVEVTSVSSSGRQLRKPIEVDRPLTLKAQRPGKAQGFAAAIAQAQEAGRVRVG